MFVQRKPINELSIEELDRELIARGAQVPEKKRFKFKDREGTPLRDEIMAQVRELYDTVPSPSPNEALRHFSTRDLIQILMLKTRDSSPARGICDVDDRTDFFDINDERVRENTDCVAAIFIQEGLTQKENGFSELKTKHYGETFNLCHQESFYHQPIAAGRLCTGFLLKKDVIATAGHCVCQRNVTAMRIAFGYKMLDPFTPVTQVSNENIYKGVEVIGSTLNRRDSLADWALIRLDREVEGRDAVSLSRASVACEQEVYVIGHPMGLPLKFAPGATVCDISQDAYFVADLDIYSGNSGSPVFDSKTHEVVGIVVRGENNDFRWSGKCWVSVIFLNARAYGRGAHCTRVSQFVDVVDSL